MNPLQIFPQLEKKDANENTVVDNFCFFMKYWGISKPELENLTIPEYLIMLDFAVRQIRAENESYKSSMR